MESWIVPGGHTAIIGKPRMRRLQSGTWLCVGGGVFALESNPCSAYNWWQFQIRLLHIDARAMLAESLASRPVSRGSPAMCLLARPFR